MFKLRRVFGFLTVAFALTFLIAATPPWSFEQDDHLGFRYAYPRILFAETAGDGKPGFHYFASRDSAAEFLVGGWNNRKGQTPEEFKRWLIAKAGGYDDVTYRPRGRSWFVLSGYRDNDIYYEKVMFSCGGQVVNVMAITYPSGQRELYDSVVERMEDNFRPAHSC